MNHHLLEVKELETSLLIDKQWYPTVDNVSFKLEKGEVLGVVGESGCGTVSYTHLTLPTSDLV